MNDVNSNKPIYLKKSVQVYKIYGVLILFSLFMSFVMRPMMSSYRDLLDLLVGLPIFIMFAMAPIGLFYSWKSYKWKEGRASTRFKYFLGHLFFCLLIIVFLTVIVNDFSKILS